MNEGFMSGSLPDLASVSGDSARWEDWVWADTAGKLASWGCGGRWPPRRFFVAPGSGGFAARTRCKTKCFLEGFALQTSHLSKPAVSRVLIQNIIPWGGLGAAKPPPNPHQKMPDQYTVQ